MEWLRSCYTSSWRLTRNQSTLTPGRYVFAPPAAPHFPTPHVYGSRNWTTDEREWSPSEIGEVDDGKQSYDKGGAAVSFPPAVQLGADDCLAGNAALPATAPTLVGGFPLACWTAAGALPLILDCTSCPNGAAYQYTIDVAGLFGGSLDGPGWCAQLNGRVTVTHASGCTWSAPWTLTNPIVRVTFTGFWTLTFDLPDNLVTFTLTQRPGGVVVTFEGPFAGDCATPIVLTMPDTGGDCQSAQGTATVAPVGEVPDVPIPGTISLWGGAAVPSGYLECDGSAVSQTTYPNLYAVLGSTWGAAAAGQFVLPDLRGRAPIGASPGGLDASRPTARALAAVGGEESHTLAVGELPAHGHPVTDPGHSHNVTDGFLALRAAVGIASGTFLNVEEETVTDAATTGITVGNSGGGIGHNTMQPFAVTRFIIKT